MTDRMRQEIPLDLHATGFGKGIACDYHARPKTLPMDEPVLIEAIRLVDHPQFDEYPGHWVIDQKLLDAADLKDVGFSR